MRVIRQYGNAVCDWVKVVGHRDVPGKPGLYATTKAFLDYFNLKSLDELPTLAEIRDLDKINEELDLDIPTPEEPDLDKMLEENQAAADAEPVDEDAVEAELEVTAEISEVVEEAITNASESQESPVEDELEHEPEAKSPAETATETEEESEDMMYADGADASHSQIGDEPADAENRITFQT